MPFLRTKLATDWPRDLGQSTGERIIRGLLWFVPEANPDYKAKMHLVHEWLIEFDAEGNPWREIGVDATGKPVLAGPDGRNFGFWLDTNMQFKDFSEGESVSEDCFEQLWKETGLQEPI